VIANAAGRVTGIKAIQENGAPLTVTAPHVIQTLNDYSKAIQEKALPGCRGRVEVLRQKWL
jgi:hypothetical protein